jgi:hypothetical protein
MCVSRCPVRQHHTGAALCLLRRLCLFVSSTALHGARRRRGGGVGVVRHHAHAHAAAGRHCTARGQPGHGGASDPPAASASPAATRRRPRQRQRLSIPRASLRRTSLPCLCMLKQPSILPLPEVVPASVSTIHWAAAAWIRWASAGVVYRTDAVPWTCTQMSTRVYCIPTARTALPTQPTGSRMDCLD